MATWVLVPALVALRRDLDAVAPGRDTRSDGSIGDAAHSTRVSDHNPDETGAVPIHDADTINEVHAIDVDVDLRQPSDLTLRRVVDHIVDRCRTGAERRLRYVIFQKIIWHVDNEWRPAPYSGSDPHTEHAHFSASYDPLRERNTADWNLGEIPVALTLDDKVWLTAQIKAQVTTALVEQFARTQQPDAGGVTSRIGRDALDQGVPNPIRGAKTPAWQLLGDIAETIADVDRVIRPPIGR